MAESGRKVEVRFGAFSCSIEGYDDPVEQMREVLLLMQGMIRETPTLVDHGPGFGEAEVARIEHALDRRAERQADGPGIIVIRGPEVTRNGDPEAEDAVTTAEFPPNARRPGEAAPELAEFVDDAPGETDEQPQVSAGGAKEPEETAPGVTPGIFSAPVTEDTAPDRDGDDDRGDNPARDERDYGEPEHPINDEAGTAPAAVAIFSAPAAAIAKAEFSADVAGTDEPEPEPIERTGPGGDAEAAADPATDAATDSADNSDPDCASKADAGAAAKTGQPDMTADADATEHPDGPPALGARTGEASRLWEAAVPDPGEAPAGDQYADIDADAAAELATIQAHAEVSDAAPADQPNHLWDDDGPGADTAPDEGPQPGEALEEAAQFAGSTRTGELAADAGQRDPFAFDEATGLPADQQVAGTDERTDAGTGEHEREITGDLRAGDADEQSTADDDRATGSEAPAAEPDRSCDDAGGEPPTDASDRDLTAAAEAVLAAHGFGPGTAKKGDLQTRHAGQGPEFATPCIVPEQQHETSADRQLNIFEPPPPSPAWRATPATAVMNIFAPPPDFGATATAAAVNIFAPPPGTTYRDAASRGSRRVDGLLARTVAGTARQQASDLRMAAAAPDDEDDPVPAPRPNGAHRSGWPGAGPRAADRPDESGSTGIAPAGEAPGGPATAVPDRHGIGLRDETVNMFAASPSDDEAQPDGGAPGQPASGWPGAAWNDRLGEGDEAVDGKSAGGSGGANGWNDGLREPPRPPRTRPNEERSRFSALLARLGGRRTSEPGPDAPPETSQDEPSSTADESDAGPANLAERAGASSVADLLAVSAAWLTLVEGKPRFTRREVMETFERLPGDHPRTLEDRIKGFGKLVRSSTLILVDDGIFAMAQVERDRYQSMIDES